jgi:hypothetical protein
MTERAAIDRYTLQEQQAAFNLAQLASSENNIPGITETLISALLVSSHYFMFLKPYPLHSVPQQHNVSANTNVERGLSRSYCIDGSRRWS